MPLTNDRQFGIYPLTEAINLLPENPTMIRSLGIFKPKYEKTTHVDVEEKDGVLSLVKTKQRGENGDPVADKARRIRTFKMLHLPKDDVVRADDVQNVREFGTQNKLQTVTAVVNEKLTDMKGDLEYTREHLMLGALLGKILDADGAELIDIYNEFGLTRKSHVLALNAANTNVGSRLDKVKTTLNKARGGESVSGLVSLCSEEFMQKFIYHESVVALYEKQQNHPGRSKNTHVEFEHKGIRFIQYDHEFASGEKIPDGEAIILPLGTRKTFSEFFAPADMNEAVNTTAKPYYASREKMKHGKGWDVHAQSNPLPMLLRPGLVQTLKVG